MSLICTITDSETNQEVFKFELSEESKDKSFVWFIYNKFENIFEGIFNKNELSILFYLATYIDYDNNIKYANGKFIQKKDLNDFLNIKKKQYYSFIKKCKENNIIYENEDNTFSLSNEYFQKGKIKNTKENKEKEKIKIYCKPIREMYRNKEENSDTYLSNIYRLIPYIGDDYNILYKKDSNFATLKDILNILGYKEGNSDRYKKNLSSIKYHGGQVIKILEDRIMLSPEIFSKSLNMPYIPRSSYNQRYLSVLLNGELNYRISRYFLDIYLKKERIDIEYDGSGHNLSVMFGQKTQEEFDREEKKREEGIISNGIKIIRLSSKTDNLPSDRDIIDIIEKCKKELSSKDKDVIRYDLDAMSIIE